MIPNQEVVCFDTVELSWQLHFDVTCLPPNVFIWHLCVAQLVSEALSPTYLCIQPKSHPVECLCAVAETTAVGGSIPKK